MASTLIDMCYDEDGEGETIQEGVDRLIAGWDDLVATIVREVGPGGGWPEVRVSGPADRVAAFLVCYHDEYDGPWVRGLIEQS